MRDTLARKQILSESRMSSAHQPSRVAQAFRVMLLILWGVTFVGAHWVATCLYLVPLLALITFSLLSPFPVVVGALFLSGYLDGSPVDPMSGTLKLLLIGATWLAALVAVSAHLAARLLRVSPAQSEHATPAPASEAAAPSAISTPEPMSSMSSEAMPSPNFRHDVRTPLNLILGFCEALLTPASSSRQPLPAPFRDDVEAIYRNGQQLRPLIEKLLERTTFPQADKSPTDFAARSRKSVILLDEGGAAFELLSQYLPQFEVIRVSSVEAIGRLRLDSDPLAVAINSDDSAFIPLVAQLTGNTVPILTFNLADAQPQMQFRGASDYLLKPVEFEALMAALERTGAALRTVLIVDDNRDNMQMLSRMLASLPEPPHLLKAYSGRETLALLHEETPDVILLDFVLPDMDGIALLNSLRADSRLARIPVLLVSAHRPPDILPLAGITKLTLFRLAGFSPTQLARHLEAILVTFGSQP